MKAVVTTGNGGYEKRDYRDVPVPESAPGDALLKVVSAGVNNTEINTRLSWYSSKATQDTEDLCSNNKEKLDAEPDFLSQKRKNQTAFGQNFSTPQNCLCPA